MLKNVLKVYREKGLSDYFSMLITLAFAIYNISIGLIEMMIWNISIAIYYVLLLSIRLLCNIRYKTSLKNNKHYSTPFYIVTTILLILLNLSLIGPAALMLMDKRDINFSLTFAIAIAAFTTYKTVIAIRNYIKYRRSNNIYNRQVSTIMLSSMAVSILTLQNTLITICSTDESKDMMPLEITSTVAMLLILFFISIYRSVSDFKYLSSHKAVLSTSPDSPK